MKKLLWFSAALFSPVPALLLYFGLDFTHLNDPFSLSMFIGLISYTYFMVVLIISGRIKALDRMYGHDRVMKFHSYLAVTAVVLAVAHRQIKIRVFPFTNMQIMFGMVALTGFMVITFLTVFLMVPNMLHRIRALDRLRITVNTNLRLDYSILKVIHNFFVVAVLALSVHVLLASSTLENWYRMIYIGGLAAFACWTWIHHKLVRPFMNGRKGFFVESVTAVSDNITEIQIKASGTAKLPAYKAGQFAFFSFKGKNLGNEEHPFTISSSPGDDTITFSAKDLGDYSAKLRTVLPGTPVRMDGPYGVFNLPPHSRKPLLFVAGGIGITPFLSILKDIKGKGFPNAINLFWGVRTKADLVYDGQLNDLQNEIDGFSYTPVISQETVQPSDGRMKSGHINDHLIVESLGRDLSDYLVYLCGPVPMMRKLVKVLRKLKVRKSNIHFEQFSLG